MLEKLRPRSAYDVVAITALFVSLGGTAVAVDGSLPGQNTVGSADIINGEVTQNDLAANAVGSAKIADQSVKNNDLSLGASASNTIADGGVRGIDIQNFSLTEDDIATDALTGAVIDESQLDPLTHAQIEDESLTGHDIQDNTIGGADVNESLLDYGVSVASFSSHDPANFDLGVATQVITLTDGRNGGLLSVPFEARLIVTASVTVHLYSGSSAFCQARIAPAGGSYTAISQHAFLRPNAADHLGSIPISAGADIAPGTYNVQIVCSGDVTGTAQFERADLTAVATSR